MRSTAVRLSLHPRDTPVAPPPAAAPPGGKSLRVINSRAADCAASRRDLCQAEKLKWWREEIPPPPCVRGN